MIKYELVSTYENAMNAENPKKREPSEENVVNSPGPHEAQRYS